MYQVSVYRTIGPLVLLTRIDKDDTPVQSLPPYTPLKLCLQGFNIIFLFLL